MRHVKDNQINTDHTQTQNVSYKLHDLQLRRVHFNKHKTHTQNSLLKNLCNDLTITQNTLKTIRNNCNTHTTFHTLLMCKRFTDITTYSV